MAITYDWFEILNNVISYEMQRADSLRCQIIHLYLLYQAYF